MFKFYWVLPIFLVFNWFDLILPGLTGFYWVLYCVLPSFTQFYLVLVGYIGFYWALPSFTELKTGPPWARPAWYWAGRRCGTAEAPSRRCGWVWAGRTAVRGRSRRRVRPCSSRPRRPSESGRTGPAAASARCSRRRRRRLASAACRAPETRPRAPSTASRRRRARGSAPPAATTTTASAAARPGPDTWRGCRCRWGRARWRRDGARPRTRWPRPERRAAGRRRRRRKKWPAAPRPWAGDPTPGPSRRPKRSGASASLATRIPPLPPWTPKSTVSPSRLSLPWIRAHQTHQSPFTMWRHSSADEQLVVFGRVAV